MPSASAADPPSAKAPFPNTAWVLIVTLTIQALASAAGIAPAILGPVVTRDLGVSTAVIGIYMSLIYLGGMTTGVVTGTLVSRFGAVRCSQAALVLCGLGMALISSGSVGRGVVGALMIGAGYGAITPSSSHLLMRGTPAHRLSLVFSIKQTGVPLGGVLAALAAPQLEAALGWRWSLAAFSIACLLCALMAQTVRRSLDADLDSPSPWKLRDLPKPILLVWRTPALRAMAICSAIFSAIQLAATAYMVTYLNLSLGWTLIAAGVVQSVLQVAGVVGRVFWGVVADRWIAPRVLLGILSVTMGVACVATAFLTPASPMWLVAAVAALYGGSALGWNGVQLAEVARRAPPGQAGLATGGSLFFTFLGVLAGQPAFSFIASLAGSATGANYAFAYGILIVPAVGCAIWLLRRPA